MDQTPFEAYRKEDGTVGLFLPSIAEAAGLSRLDVNDLEVDDPHETEAPDAGADTAETEEPASDAPPVDEMPTPPTEDAAPKARNRR